jgi:Holliday junction resolvase
MENLYEERKKIGDIGEDRISEFFKSEGMEVIYRADPNKNFPYYDIVVLNEKSEGKITTIEVKLDRYNNDIVAIECEQSGLSSGINVTTADLYFVYKSALDKIYWIPTKDLKKHIKDKALRPIDCNKEKTKCYLVSVFEFELVS